MRSELRTAFWRQAAQRLPAPVRARYLGHFEMAERWELALERLIELVADAKALFHRR